jgi:hypothetical protein
VVYTTRYRGQPRPTKREFWSQKGFAWLHAAVWLTSLAAAIIWLRDGWVIVPAIVFLMFVTPDAETLFGSYRRQIEQWTAGNQPETHGPSGAVLERETKDPDASA